MNTPKGRNYVHLHSQIRGMVPRLTTIKERVVYSRLTVLQLYLYSERPLAIRTAWKCKRESEYDVYL